MFPSAFLVFLCASGKMMKNHAKIINFCMLQNKNFDSEMKRKDHHFLFFCLFMARVYYTKCPKKETYHFNHDKYLPVLMVS